jgi:hypothetical protein
MVLPHNGLQPLLRPERKRGGLSGFRSGNEEVSPVNVVFTPLPPVLLAVIAGGLVVFGKLTHGLHL